jgi:hypothetical protein
VRPSSRLSLTATGGTIATAIGGLFGSGTDTYGVADRLGEHLRLREEPGEPRLLQGRAGRDSHYQKAIQTAFREVADALAQRGTIDEQVRAQTARARRRKWPPASPTLTGRGWIPSLPRWIRGAVPMPPNSSWSPPG